MQIANHFGKWFCFRIYSSGGFNLRGPLERANPNHWTNFHLQTKGGPHFLYSYSPLYCHWPLFISTNLAIVIASVIFFSFIFANFFFIFSAHILMSTASFGPSQSTSCWHLKQNFPFCQQDKF
jgi:hypothetical protein